MTSKKLMYYGIHFLRMRLTFKLKVGKRMWDTFFSHSAYIQITFAACQG